MSYRSIFRDDLFRDQTIVVTGGGSGIGRCTAHELARLGARVVLVGRKQEKLDRVLDELREDGFANATAHRCDIREEASVQAMVKAIVAANGRIHGLVNNAGGQFPSPLMMISQKGFETVVRTNLVGGFLVAREVFLQTMREHGGVIVNIVADIWRGMPGMGHSGAARAGMVNLTETMAVEWASFGVRVNAVAPGWIASSGMDNYEGPITELIPKLKDSLPAKRMGTESEVSAAISFLLSEGAAFITGTTLRVDGAAPLHSHIFPTLPHENMKPFDGFHRASLPKILKGEE